MSWFLRNWQIVVGTLVLAALLSWHVGAIRKAEKRGYKAAEAVMAADVAKANADAAKREEQTRINSREVDIEHQKVLADLRAKYDAVVIKPVRLCASASGGKLPKDSGSTAEHLNSPGGNGLSEPVARDLGPDLERFARLADEQTQRLVACQKFVKVLTEK